jgi:hypothetical protein
MQLLAPVLCFAAASPLLADVKVYQNDSLPAAGGTVACQAGFASNEIGAAVYTVPSGDGKVLLLQAQFWACDGSGLGLASARPVQVLAYPAGGPNPGAPLYTSPTLTALPGFLNLWPLEPANLAFDAGETFTLGVKLLNGGLFQNFTTLATDADGCQSGKSLIFAVPGGWTDACALGVSGDMFVRVRVLTEGPTVYGSGTPGSGGAVPAIDSSGAWMIGSGSFAVTASAVLAGAPGFLGYSTSPAVLPAFGGTILINPASAGASFLPVAASGSGTSSVALSIPGGNPALVGVHVYFQYGYVDPGAAGGVSMSAGLDVKLSNNT